MIFAPANDEAPDPFDPRGWAAEPVEPRRTYIAHGEHLAEVDPDLWPILARYSWNSFLTLPGKRYFRRSAHSRRKDGARTTKTVLLHREVLILSGQPEPFAKCVGDHRDGNEADCRIANLRWTTYLGNLLNRADADGNRPMLDAAE